jgi:hypothetical protein
VKRRRRNTSKKRDLGKYKSALEKACADSLAESGLSFTYEETEYIIVDKFKYEGVYHKMTPKGKDLRDRSGAVVLPIKYTPDFVATDGSWIIETKGYTPSHHDFPMRWKLFLKYLSELGKPLPSLFICRNKQQIDQAIEIIKSNSDAKDNTERRRRRRKHINSDAQDAPDGDRLL